MAADPATDIVDDEPVDAASVGLEDQLGAQAEQAAAIVGGADGATRWGGSLPPRLDTAWYSMIPSHPVIWA